MKVQPQFLSPGPNITVRRLDRRQAIDLTTQFLSLIIRNQIEISNKALAKV